MLQPLLFLFGYTYNPVGNILDILDQVNPAENRSHTYDALQRLKTGGAVANAETYDYDLVGNRTTSFLSTTHNHDDLNRLLEDDAFTYTYDNNGNLRTKTDKGTPTDVTTYTWDAQDQLIQIDRPDSTTVMYKYDGLGRRIEKNVAGTINRYVYDGEDILLEYDGSNTFLARYSHGDQVDQPLVLQKGGVGFFYYHSNHQGSITHLTDSGGSIANSYIYDSYGRRLTVAESVIQPFSYTGREYDAESGLYFYRARYYDSDTGRFLSEDPIRFRAGDQNLFRYILNNPLNLRDPFGLIKATSPIKGVIAGGVGELVGGLIGAAIFGGFGASTGVPALAIAGALVGSQIGSSLGAKFDSPSDGQLNFEEGTVPQASEFLTTPLPPEAANESGNQGGQCGNSSSGKSGNSGSAGNPFAGSQSQGSGQRSAINPFPVSPFLGGQ